MKLEQATFIPTGERAPGFALRKVAEGKPDLVAMPIGAWLFNTPFVWLRVQRFFGQRAGRWFRGVEQAVDGATYERGRVRAWVNRALRGTAHRILGGEPITTWEESAACFEETFKLLAREEEVDLAAVPYPQRRNIYSDPKQVETRHLFMDAVRASAEARRYQWVGTDEAYKGEAVSGDMQADGLHVSRERHEVLGELVAGVYLESLRKREGAAGE